MLWLKAAGRFHVQQVRVVDFRDPNDYRLEQQVNKLNGDTTMRFTIIVKAAKDSEVGIMPRLASKERYGGPNMKTISRWNRARSA